MKDVSLKKALLTVFITLLVVFPVVWFTAILPVHVFYDFIGNFYNKADNYINNEYPSDLTVKVTKGVVSVNKTLPYCLMLDKKTKIGILFKERLIDNDLNGYRTMYKDLCYPIAKVSRNYILYSKKDKIYSVRKIPSSVNVVISKMSLRTKLEKNYPRIVFMVKKMYFSLPFLAVFFIFFTMLIANLWYAFVLKLVARFTSFKEITFKQAYTVTLLAYLVWFMFKYIGIMLVLSRMLGTYIRLSFPFLGTIFIVLGSVIYLDKGNNQSWVKNKE